MEHITIIKLAKLLKLSKSTIARAFETKNNIRPETRKRILEKAAELNFQPDHFAAALRKGSSNTLGIIVPEIANVFFSKAICGIENYAKNKQYNVLIYNSDGILSKEQDILNNLADGRVDGIIMSASEEDHNYILNFQNIPFVFFDKACSDMLAPKVLTDDRESSFLATEHLIQNGCKRIACAVINRKVSIERERVLGYKEALGKHKMPFSEKLIINCSNDLASNIRIIKKALKNERVDAVFATVERLAFAVYFVCQQEEILIPEDIKVIGFSSLEIAPLLSPSLSTITQPASEIGNTAAELLFEQIEGNSNLDKTIILKSNLVFRKSSS